MVVTKIERTISRSSTITTHSSHCADRALPFAHTHHTSSSRSLNSIQSMDEEEDPITRASSDLDRRALECIQSLVRTAYDCSTRLNKEVPLSELSEAELGVRFYRLLEEMKDFDSERVFQCQCRSKAGPLYEQVKPSLQNSSNAKRAVRYIHLFEETGLFNMGLFIFPPYARIPLHDHPHMMVFSKVVYGELQTRSYTISDEESSGRGLGLKLVASLFSSSKSPKKLTCEKAPVRVVRQGEVSVLYPKTHNLHEFQAGPNGAAVLDVLLPPYDEDHDRDCNFFVDLSTDVPDSTTCTQKVQLQSSYQPEDFICQAGSFYEFGEDGEQEEVDTHPEFND